MIIFPLKTLSATGFSGIIQPYGIDGIVVGQLGNQAITSLGLICTVSSGGSLTYSVQITGDPNPSASGNWNDHEVLTALTASNQSNILYGVSGIRLHCSVWASGSITLGVVQWP